jgi:peptide/nickel transport system ATP-binding protein
LLLEPLTANGIADGRARLRQTLDEVGLTADIARRYPHQLSGGQRQQVAIARALMLRPSPLLWDEPTSALDMSVQAEILNLLNAVKAAHRITLVLVSHDMDVIAHLCERAAVMNAGKIERVLGRRELT